MKVIGRKVQGDSGFLVELGSEEFQALTRLARAVNGELGIDWWSSSGENYPLSEVDLSGTLKAIREFANDLSLLNQLKEQLERTRESLETAFGKKDEQPFTYTVKGDLAASASVFNSGDLSGSTSTNADEITVNKPAFMKP